MKPGKLGAQAAGGEPGTSLAMTSGDKRVFGARAITKELAEKFAKELLSDISHSVESACQAVGLRAGTVREAIQRFDKARCRTAEDEEICEILAAAKTKHVHELRKYGFGASGRGNGPGANWVKWQLEVQDPVHHPRRTELSGPGGGPMEHRHASLKDATVEELQEIIASTEPEE